jgi:hypothetical protein
MTLSKILTIINIMGGTAAFCCLFLTMRNYILGRYMKNYIFLLFASMAMLVLGQFFTIVYEIETNWKLKLIGIYLWYKAIYFAWAIRFTSIKK